MVRWALEAAFNQNSVVNMMEQQDGCILAFVLRGSVDQSCSVLSINTSLSGLHLTASSCWSFPFRAEALGARTSLDGSSNLTAEMDEQHPVHTCVTASTYTCKHTRKSSPNCCKETSVSADFGYRLKTFSELHTFLNKVAFTSSMTFFILNIIQMDSPPIFTLVTW